MLIADCKRSRGASIALSVFIVRITCWSWRSVSTQSEHVEIWATALSSAAEVARPSTRSTRASSEICDEVFMLNRAYLLSENTFASNFFKIRSNLPRQRARVGPILPSGIPSDTAISE